MTPILNGRAAGRRREAGSALLIVTMVAVILTLLGLSYLALADQENQIALNQRDSDQLLAVAEAGAKMVKQWFDRPTEGDPNVPSSVIWKFMDTLDLRNPALYDFAQRVYDHDNDPNTADVAASLTDPNRPQFRQGMILHPGTTYLSMWDKPYRGSNTSEFKGTEAGPDVVMVSNTTSVDPLDIINSLVVGDQKTQETVGRIQRIDVYAPPIIVVNGVRTRYGIGTVKVTAGKFRRMSSVGVRPVITANSVQVGERVVKMVLNETPYPGPSGPFQSCVDFQTNGNVEIHWGEVTSSTTGIVGAGHAQMLANTPPSVPWASVNKYISGATLAAWLAGHVNDTVSPSPDLWFDPWFKLRAGLDIDTTHTAQQPHPYSGNPADPLDSDDSNIFQSMPPQCPDFDYQTWKNVAVSGGQNIHYMVYVADDSYREDGAGTAKSLKDWTNGQEGFWFFDTTDRQSPDPNGANIGGEVDISGSWNSAGFIYLNAAWNSSGMAAGGGANRVIIPPSEPWVDADGDKVVDPGEWVNLTYPTGLTGKVYVDANAPVQTATVTSTNGVTYTYTTDPNVRDMQGPPFTGAITYYGVLYAAGSFEATGNMKVYGSIVAKGGMQAGGGGPTAGTPFVLFDERLIKGDWPPPDLNLPRTTITFWQTEM